ncbi:hypothetical protein [Ekhidna sp.]|uniref:hypothetical protein n=1 Tax=Ekhidna sp. TaxID=2608089 RepID=UPI0035172059
MNKTKIIEIVILTAIAVLQFLPTNNPSLAIAANSGTLVLSFIVIAFIGGVFYVFILGKIKNPKSTIEKPELGNNPFNLNSPLEGIFLLSLFFISNGLAMNFGSLFHLTQLSHIGTLAIAYGLGLILTIYLALRKRQMIEKRE